jgi:hypothetical protein
MARQGATGASDHKATQAAKQSVTDQGAADASDHGADGLALAAGGVSAGRRRKRQGQGKGGDSELCFSHGSGTPRTLFLVKVTRNGDTPIPMRRQNGATRRSFNGRRRPIRS